MDKNKKNSANRRKSVIRKVTALVLCILMVLAYVVSMADFVHADTNNVYLYDASGIKMEGTLSYITDLADILTDEEESDLEIYAQSLALEYECNTYILTVSDMALYTDNGDTYQFAKDIYDTYNLGYGDSRDGTILVLSIADRSWGYAAYGDFANTAYTDYAKSTVEDEFLSYFGDDLWYDGFEAYLEGSETCLSAAAEGNPIDSSGGITDDPKFMMIIFIAAGFIIALIVVLIMRSSMKSAVAAAEARNYIVPGTFDVTRHRDLFTHTTESRVKIETDSDSGGGTSVGSDGFSGGSGHF